MSKPILPAPTTEFLADAALKLIAAAPAAYGLPESINVEAAVADALALFCAAAETAAAELADQAGTDAPPETSGKPLALVMARAHGVKPTVTKNTTEALPNHALVK